MEAKIKILEQSVIPTLTYGAQAGSLKPGLHLNANKRRMRHAKMKRSFNVGVLSRRGKQHLAV